MTTRKLDIVTGIYFHHDPPSVVHRATAMTVAPFIRALSARAPEWFSVAGGRVYGLVVSITPSPSGETYVVTIEPRDEREQRRARKK